MPCSPNNIHKESHNLNTEDNSVLLRLAVLIASNFGVHHSNKENCICLWLCPPVFCVCLVYSSLKDTRNHVK